MNKQKINEYVLKAHNASLQAGWWDLDSNLAEKLCLIHSELSEALKGVKKNCRDDKLPEFKMEHVEIADAFIRGCDYMGYRGFDYISINTPGVTINGNAYVSIANLHEVISDAMEGLRRGNEAEEMERMSAFLRACATYSDIVDFDLAHIVDLKMAFNAERSDHKPEERAKKGGKKF